MENLLQLVSDPNVEFEEDHESVQEMLRLIERLPTAMESSNINRIMEELNGSGQRRYDSAADVDGGVGRRDGGDPEHFGQFTTTHLEQDTDISGISGNKVQKRIGGIGHLDSATNVVPISKQGGLRPKGSALASAMQPPPGTIHERKK